MHGIFVAIATDVTKFTCVSPSSSGTNPALTWDRLAKRDTWATVFLSLRSCSFHPFCIDVYITRSALSFRHVRFLPRFDRCSLSKAERKNSPMESLKPTCLHCW